MPAIRLGNGDELGPGAIAIYADALRVRAKMTTPGEAIAAMPAGDVAFAGDEVAFGKTFDVIADKIDNADKLVADGHRDRDRLLRPRVPVVNVNVGSADRRLQNADEDIVAFDLWDGNFFQPKSGPGAAFDDGLHCFLHKTN